MKKYIKQLLSDLKAAQRPEIEFEEQTFEQYIKEVEAFLAYEDDPSSQIFSEACGIQKMQFPPAEKLNIQEMEILCAEIKELMHTWNLDLSLPDTLPVERAYHYLTEVFDTKTMITDSGHVGLELCQYVVKGCVFGRHCMCKEFEKEH